MQLTLFHASPVNIKKFYIPYGGLHFGGINSALEAALRKVRISKSKIVYLHECTVNVNSFFECEDLCTHDDWERHIEYMKIHEKDNVLKYKNKFEPDVVPSYVVWDENLVKIVNVKVLTQDEAEDIVMENMYARCKK